MNSKKLSNNEKEVKISQVKIRDCLESVFDYQQEQLDNKRYIIREIPNTYRTKMNIYIDLLDLEMINHYSLYINILNIKNNEKELISDMLKSEIKITLETYPNYYIESNLKLKISISINENNIFQLNDILEKALNLKIINRNKIHALLIYFYFNTFHIIDYPKHY